MAKWHCKIKIGVPGMKNLEEKNSSVKVLYRKRSSLNIYCW